MYETAKKDIMLLLSRKEKQTAEDLFYNSRNCESTLNLRIFVIYLCLGKLINEGLIKAVSEIPSYRYSLTEKGRLFLVSRQRFEMS